MKIISLKNLLFGNLSLLFTWKWNHFYFDFQTNITEGSSISPSTTPQVYTELTPKTSSLGVSPVTENFIANASESPIKITTIRFNYPFLTSDLSTPSTIFLETSETKMDSLLESTTSYGVGGHARPHSTEKSLLGLTPPPGNIDWR